MDFVGRKREIAAVMRSLAQGRNVVVTGRFGIGRSRMVKQMATLHADTWQFLFADFSRPASQSCNDLIHQILPHRGGSRRNRYTRMSDAKDILAGKTSPAHLPRVVVLDNIGKISRPKLAFIRDLRFDGELLFIAIVERFLPEADLFLLRSVLYPADTVLLQNLGKKETEDFFRTAARKKNLDWDEKVIRGLAASSEGYPLLMTERLHKEMSIPFATNRHTNRPPINTRPE